ncbi:MAG: hypothetical protein CMJ89_05870 [Planctomycetes bacterium]|nr:hypothetical protein [Planctomycetota bacterium]
MSDRKLDHLFRRFQSRGDPGALARVFDLAAPELLRVAQYLSSDRVAAEDCLQQTFLFAIENRERFEPSARVMPWLLGILAKHAKKAHARSGREPDPERLRPRPEPEDPANVAADREFKRLVEESVSSLPQKYAAVVRAYLDYGKSPREIARTFGITANAASVRIHRGLDLLRRALPKGAAIGTAAAAASAQGAGLSQVRAAVLAQAKATVPQIAIASSTSTLFAATLLGTMTMTKFTLLAGGLLVACGLTFSLTRRANAAELERLHAELTRLQASLNEVRGDAAERPTASRDSQPEVASARTEPGESEEREPVVVKTSAEQWLRRISEAPSWQEALSVARELAKLDPDESLRIMQEIFQRIPDPNYRRQILKAFLFSGGLPNAVEICHLATQDPDFEVQERGFEYIENYAFENFISNRLEYDLWRTRFGGKPIDEIPRVNVGEFVQRLSLMSQAELRSVVEDFRNMHFDTGRSSGVDLKELFRSAGFEDVVAAWIRPGADDRVISRSLTWVSNLGATENWLRHHILPVIQSRELYGDSITGSAFRALGQKGNTWAIEPITDAMLARPTDQHALPYSDAASALAEIGDRSVIPTMIGMIASRDEYATRYGVGYFGLRHLTGVDYDESHGADFWLEWWEKNRHFMPAEIQGMDIPHIALY